MKNLLKIAFFALVVKPLVLVVLGLNLIGREKLPKTGPAVIIANHNSHLDSLVLMSLYPVAILPKIRPVAAADYFLRNRVLAWLSIHCIGIIPFDRSGGTGKEELFAECHRALDNGDILIFFPEGSRGSPEKMSKIKKGIFYLIKDRPGVPVTPVAMHGLGRSLPKGEALFVPFNCDVVVGDPLTDADNSAALVENIAAAFDDLFKYCLTRHETG
ncbi:MAG: lysophospholipid acyltransferase family protein [Gammaproteobacteria bacterium]